MNNPYQFGTVLGFLDELSRNNNRAWFEQHRPDYQAARAAFERFVDAIIDEFRASDQLEGLSARECIARIFRDIRFSKDKTPYKTNLAALIAPGGWRGSAFGYYLSVAPNDQTFAAGGLHEPKPEQLERFRQAIDRDASAFKKAIQAHSFVASFGAVEGERLKTAPRGYDRAHPEIGLLQLKQIMAFHRFTDREVLAVDFREKVLDTCRAMRPFLDYLEEAMQSDIFDCRPPSFCLPWLAGQGRTRKSHWEPT
jgi:uncharacterized protein (TIGR02453 family)